MAVTVLSFGVVPAYMGISSEHDALVANIEPAVGGDLGALENGTALSFEEIYALTDVYSDTSMAQDDIAFILNNIEPTAGGDLEEMIVSEDVFSTDFKAHSHPAL